MAHRRPPEVAPRIREMLAPSQPPPAWLAVITFDIAVLFYRSNERRKEALRTTTRIEVNRAYYRDDI